MKLNSPHAEKFDELLTQHEFLRTLMDQLPKSPESETRGEPLLTRLGELRQHRPVSVRVVEVAQVRAFLFNRTRPRSPGTPCG